MLGEVLLKREANVGAQTKAAVEWIENTPGCRRTRQRVGVKKQEKLQRRLRVVPGLLDGSGLQIPLTFLTYNVEAAVRIDGGGAGLAAGKVGDAFLSWSDAANDAQFSCGHPTRRALQRASSRHFKANATHTHARRSQARTTQRAHNRTGKSSRRYHNGVCTNP